MNKCDVWVELSDNRGDLFPCAEGVYGLSKQGKLVREVIRIDLIVVSRIEHHMVAVLLQQLPFGESDRILSPILLIKVVNEQDSHALTRMRLSPS
jgi:hypothetical protein